MYLSRFRPRIELRLPHFAVRIFKIFWKYFCLNTTTINWLFFLLFIFFLQVIHECVVFTCQTASKRKRLLGRMGATKDQQQRIICSAYNRNLSIQICIFICISYSFTHRLSINYCVKRFAGGRTVLMSCITFDDVISLEILS